MPRKGNFEYVTMCRWRRSLLTADADRDSTFLNLESNEINLCVECMAPWCVLCLRWVCWSSFPLLSTPGPLYPLPISRLIWINWHGAKEQSGRETRFTKPKLINGVNATHRTFTLAIKLKSSSFDCGQLVSVGRQKVILYNARLTQRSTLWFKHKQQTTNTDGAQLTRSHQPGSEWWPSFDEIYERIFDLDSFQSGHCRSVCRMLKRRCFPLPLCACGQWNWI